MIEITVFQLTLAMWVLQKLPELFKGRRHGKVTSNPLCPFGVYGPNTGGGKRIAISTLCQNDTPNRLHHQTYPQVSYFMLIGGSEVSTSPDKEMKRSASPGNGRCNTVVDSLIRKSSIHGRTLGQSRVPRAYRTRGLAKREGQVNEADKKTTAEYGHKCVTLRL